MNLNKLTKREWFDVSKRGKPHAILWIDSVGEGIKRDYAKKIYNQNYRIKNYRQFDSKRSIGISDYKKIVKILEKKAKFDPEVSSKITGIMERYAKEIIKWTDRLKSSKWGDMSDGQLLKVLEKGFDFQAKLWNGGFVYAYYFFFNDIFVEKLVKNLRNSGKLNDNLMKYLTSPVSLTMIGEEKLSLLKIAKKYFLSKKVDIKALKKHHEKYAFLKRYYYWGNGFTFDEIKNRFEDLLQKGEDFIDKEIANLKPVVIKYSDYKLSAYNERAINSARKSSFVMNLADEVSSYYVHHLMGMFYEIAHRLGISYEQLVSMRFEEIKNSILNKKLVAPAEELTMRLKDHAIIFENGISIIFIGKELEDYRKKQIPVEIVSNTIREIRGAVAVKSNERIVGRVRVIKSLDQINEFVNGEILVTQMTNPNFVPIMEKSLAIITDEGGLLCHAAIVSREIHKPCIIGTKNATRVLKDGDLVEVDADRGIIKIKK